jgi:hypothetical protein
MTIHIFPSYSLRSTCGQANRTADGSLSAMPPFTHGGLHHPMCSIMMIRKAEAERGILFRVQIN